MVEALSGKRALSEKKALSEKGRGHLVTGKVSYFSAGQLGEGYKRYEKWLNAMSTHREMERNLFIECVIPSPAWLMRREDFEKVGYAAEVCPEDYDFCFRIFLGGIKVIKIPQCVLRWRDYRERTSRVQEAYRSQHFWRIKVSYFKKMPPPAFLSKALYIWGGGKKGKGLARECQKQGLVIKGILTNNINKIGQTCYRLPFIADEVGIKSQTPILLSLSSPADLSLALKRLAEAGKVAGRDFLRMM